MQLLKQSLQVKLSTLTLSQLIKLIDYTITFLIIAWFVVSYIDIVAHNQTTHDYISINLFTLF